MKRRIKLRKFLIWLSISIAVQFSFLLALDKWYFEAKMNPKFDKVVKNDTTDKDKNKVPEKAQKIRVSSDGNFLSYFDGVDLKVINVQDNTVKMLKFENNSTVSYYRWAENKARIIISGKHYDNLKQTMDFLYLDLEGQSEEKNTYVKLGSITLPDNVSEVVDLKPSWTTDSAYAKVMHSGKKVSIYKLNPKQFMEKITLKSFNVGNIDIMKKSDKLIYEDLNYNKLYITDGKKTEEITGLSKGMRLLYVDKDDNIYLSLSDGDTTNSLYVGRQDQPVKNWRKITFEAPVKISDIKFNASGEIYMNNNLKGILTETATGKETQYEGVFVNLYDGGIASLSDRILLKTKFTQ